MQVSIEQTPEQMIVLDSCVVIDALTKPNIAKKILALFRGKRFRVVLQDVVLTEVHRILRISKEEIIRKMSLILYKEPYLFTTTEQMRQISAEIQQKYGICHFPDSLIVAACKLLSWTLFSFDRNMLQSAEFEGILAFNPSRVRRF
jgi:predicted nucleic acid-binding protein